MLIAKIAVGLNIDRLGRKMIYFWLIFDISQGQLKLSRNEDFGKEKVFGAQLSFWIKKNYNCCTILYVVLTISFLDNFNRVLMDDDFHDR